jgi:hypothetical protein
MQRNVTSASVAAHTEPAFYPDDLQPALQDALALLANIDAHYDEERARLERWSGPDSMKARLGAQLEDAHRQEREPLVQRLAHIHQRWRAATIYRHAYSVH